LQAAAIHALRKQAAAPQVAKQARQPVESGRFIACWACRSAVPDFLNPFRFRNQRIEAASRALKLLVLVEFKRPAALCSLVCAAPPNIRLGCAVPGYILKFICEYTVSHLE
jgi:hypothetical protein